MQDTIVDMQNHAQIDTVPFEDGRLVTRIIVAEANQGRGVGRALMARLLKAADEEKITLYLEVNPYGLIDREGLERWYERCEFRKEALWLDGDLITLYVRRPKTSVTQ